MVTSIVNDISVRLNLRNGYDPQTGDIKTAPVYLGNINPDTYDPDKVLTIAEYIAPCLTKSLYSVQEIKTSNLVHSS